MTQLPKDPKKAQSILRAAVKVFARDGLDKGTIADIAREAGIGKGTVYEYFTSKDEIFAAIESAMMEEIVDALEQLNAMDLTPTDKLRTFMRMSTEMIFEMHENMLILVELWAQAIRNHWHDDEPSALVDAYERIRDRIILILQDGEQRGEFRPMNKDGVSTLLTAFIDGLIWQFMIIRDRERFEKAVMEGIHSFLKGIEK